MKRFFRTISIVSCLCLCLAMTTLQVNAVDVSSAAISLDLAAGSIELYESEGVTYCVQNGVTQATTGGVILRQTDSKTKTTSNTVTLSGGNCKLTISDLNIEGYMPIGFIRGGSLELTLLGNNIVTATDGSAGIRVCPSAVLVIGGTGSLTATGGDRSIIGGGAGIGGCDREDSGSITINSGTIIATGGECAAGIGSGIEGDGGTITINGGTVNSTGGDKWGAGIGGGGLGTGGIITINGGTVTATGNGYGSGIGGGYESAGGTVVINGGTIYATDGRLCADIGEGYGGTFDSVTISSEACVLNKNYQYGHTLDVRETIFIDIQPLPSAAYLGNIPTVFVKAHNHSGLFFQWQVSKDNYSWTDLQDQTSATPSLTMSEVLDGSYIRCRLTNGWGNIRYTDSAQLYVLAFAQQPTNVDANLNDMVAFEALSTCSNVTYQWQRSYNDGATWSNVPNETYSTLIVNATLSESNAKYRCVITATNGDQLASDVVSVSLDLGAPATYTVQDFMQTPDGSSYTMEHQQVLEWYSGETISAPTDGYDGFTHNTSKGVLSGIVAEDNSLVLTRYFDRNTYTITFDTNGGSTIAPITQNYGTPVVITEVPTMEGYTFDGWHEVIPETMPAENITLTAIWMVNQYTITFDTNGGSEIEAITQNYKTAVTAPAHPTKAGYTFDGWSPAIPTTMPAENMTVTAQWKAKQYTITFDTNGGSTVPAITQNYGTTVTAPAAPTKAGYAFDGWYIDEELTMGFVFDTMPLNGATLYAKWISTETDLSGEYQINSITARDSDGAELSVIPDEEFLATVSITNLASEGNTLVFLASYTDEGQYQGMMWVSVEDLPVGATCKVTLPVDNSDGKIENLKAFTVASFSNLTPLGDVVSFLTE